MTISGIEVREVYNGIIRFHERADRMEGSVAPWCFFQGKRVWPPDVVNRLMDTYEIAPPHRVYNRIRGNDSPAFMLYTCDIEE